MRITATVTEQLRLLQGDLPRAGDFAAALNQLSRDVAVEVPSCLAVTITLARLGGEISVGTTAEPAAVLASLAVPLAPVSSGSLLVLRAGEAGAFMLLADDLDELLGPGHSPIDVDQHLAWPTATSGESFTTSLADLSVVNHAVGVLVDRGLPPRAAHRELRRRAGATGTTLVAVSHDLLRSPQSDPGLG
jgi:hypothetical protein